MSYKHINMETENRHDVKIKTWENCIDINLAVLDITRSMTDIMERLAKHTALTNDEQIYLDISLNNVYINAKGFRKMVTNIVKERL